MTGFEIFAGSLGGAALKGAAGAMGGLLVKALTERRRRKGSKPCGSGVPAVRDWRRDEERRRPWR